MSTLSTAWRLLPALLLTSLLGVGARAEVPARFWLSYEVWTGGFNGLRLEARLARSEDSYRVSFAARTKGLIGWLFPYSLTLKTSGLIEEAGLKPQRFHTAYPKRGKMREREIFYSQDGVPTVKVDGRIRTKSGKSVPGPLTLGSLDPASAVFSIIETFARTYRCDGIFQVFDGKRRYDLRVTEVGRRNLRPSRYGMYSGSATVCRVAIGKRAGFGKRERAGSGFPSNLEIWLAPLEDGTLAIPVRLEWHNDLGAVVAHLVAGRVDSPAEFLFERAGITD
jgi:hypothetical protein